MEGWRMEEVGESSGRICAIGEIECIIRMFTRRSLGERGGDAAGEQKGESNNSVEGEEVGASGDP